jgi:hypothetical protein
LPALSEPEGGGGRQVGSAQEENNCFRQIYGKTTVALDYFFKVEGNKKI